MTSGRPVTNRLRTLALHEVEQNVDSLAGSRKGLFPTVAQSSVVEWQKNRRKASAPGETFDTASDCM